MDPRVRLTVPALVMAACVCLLAWAPGPEAQPAAGAPRVGILSAYSSSTIAPWLQVFRHGLRDLGWVEGKNIGLEYRYADGRRDRLPDLAAELVRLKVDVIVTSVDADALAAKNATTQIPIVMATPTDPVAFGLVQTLARPGEISRDCCDL